MKNQKIGERCQYALTDNIRKLRRTGGQVVFVFFAVALLISGCARQYQNAPSKATKSAPAFPVKVVTIVPSDFRTAITVWGEAAAVRDIGIASQVNGKVTQVGPDVGDHVGAGQPLVQVDGDTAGAQLDAARSAYTLAESTNRRQQYLAKQNFVPSQAIESTTAQLDAAKSQYNLAAINYAHTTIRSPISGIVASRFVNKGELIGVGTLVYNVVDLSALKVMVYVTQADYASISVGQKVSVIVPNQSVTLTGVVRDKGPKASPKNRLYPIQVGVNNPGEKIPAGMMVQVILPIKTVHQALVVRHDWIMEGESRQIAVVKNGVVEVRKIAVGPRNGDWVQVTAGLFPNDQVITEGFREVANGQTVTVIK